MLNKIAGQNIVGSKTLVKEVHPSLNSSVLSDLQPNAEYSIQILAYNIQGDGVMSAVSYGGMYFPPVCVAVLCILSRRIYRLVKKIQQFS